MDSKKEYGTEAGIGRDFPSKIVPTAVAGHKIEFYQQRRRTDKYCTPVTMTVQELVDKLSVPVVGVVTAEEYAKLTRTEQVNEKDVGGFVLAQLEKGIRNKHTVSNLAGIALDADFADVAIFEKLKLMELMYGYFTIIYSTRKHTREKPRYRVIILFSHPVTPEEHSAIGRKLAEHICGDLAYFDKTTFESNRMMFYPSISKDAEYVFDVMGDRLCDPEEVLAEYKDWRDSSSWPLCPEESNIVSGVFNGTSGRRLKDPLERDGIVGAFNRAYTVQDVLSLWGSDVYEPAANGRYSYKEADSVAGVVVYNDRFFYSFHASDPLSYEVLNAFDLARKLKFGDMDKDTHSGTAANKLPSHKEMMKFAREDPAVREMLARMKQEKARADFGPVGGSGYDESVAIAMGESRDRADGHADGHADSHAASHSGSVQGADGAPGTGANADSVSSDGDACSTSSRGCDADGASGSASDSASGNGPAADTKWRQKLEYDNYGNMKSNMYNAILILTHDPRLRCIVYNIFADQLEFRPGQGVPDVPWKHPSNIWRDVDDAQLITYIELNYGSLSERIYKNALAKVADDRSYHPIKEYLEALPAWDGIPRVDLLLVNCLGAKDTPYTRAIMRKTLVAAIARIYQPGIKFDTTLVLCGPQGTGKSTMVAKLGKNWFNDSLSLADTRDKTAAEKIQGSWIMEIGELAGMRKADQELLKGFFSRQNDIFRPAFGRRSTPHPRQVIFIGTTNAEQGFLRDVTGGRRFWPVSVPGFDRSSVNQASAVAVDRDSAVAVDRDSAVAVDQASTGSVGDKAVSNESAESDTAVHNAGTDPVGEVQWPPKPSWSLTDDDVAQIWAEAMLYYRAGEPLVLPPDMSEEVRANQRASMETDDRESLVQEYLEKLLPENWYNLEINRRINFLNGGEFDGQKLVGTVRREKVCNMEIWTECFGNVSSKIGRADSNQIIAMLERIPGWVRSPKKARVKPYGVVTVYVRDDGV